MSRQIPTITLPGGGKLPKLYMGAGDFTAWLKAAGKGAGVKTASVSILARSTVLYS